MYKFKQTVLLLLGIGFAALAIFSGSMVIKELSDRQKDKDTFSELANIVYTSPDNTANNNTSKDVSSDTKNPGSDDIDVIEDLTPQYPVTRNLSPLYDENDEFYSWLCIPDTVIDYPVMFTPNEPQKYLHLNFYGEKSNSGTLFLDERCKADSDNLIVFGHNMKNGTMFGSLKKYADEQYLKNHPIIEWETTNGCEEFEIFAMCYIQKTDSLYDFIDTYDQEEYDQWIEYILQKAKITTGKTPKYGQQLLTLSTCYGSGTDVRLLVIAAHIL